jgi:SAM-dependent methyltransferase
MRFSRKLRKLFSTELFASAFEHLGRATHPVNRSRILDGINWLQFKDLRHKYPYRPGSPQINRFEDVVYWIDINIERAQDLWLHRAPPLRLLDLGCGAGYFLYVCKQLGHNVLGFDTDHEPLFGAIVQLLDVPRALGRIGRQTPLPDLAGRFDLVTAHRVCFHRIGKVRDGVEWSPADWEFFISDIRTRFLNEEGRLLLDLNPRPDGSSFFTAELREFFLSQGARIFRSKALLAKDPNVRPKFRQTHL